MQAQVSLNSGLLGLGAVALGLATSSAHKDALLGTAFLGGTAYAFGQQNLNKQRLKIYQAGIDAINCAKRVVAPLAMSQSHVGKLDVAMQDLRQQANLTIEAKSQVGQDLALWNAQSPEDTSGSAAAQASTSAASTAIDSANKMSTAAGQAGTKVEQVGDKLVDAVDKIRGAVQTIVLDTVPDTSAVFKVLPSLASFAGLIVPGADVAINAALNKRRDSFSPQGRSLKGGGGQDISNLGAKLGVSIAKLNAQTDKLLAQIARVNGLIPSSESLASPEGLKDCGVINVDIALKAPSSVNVPEAAKTVYFSVSGGTTPYVAQFQISPTPGLSLRSPISHDGKFTIEVTQDAKAGSYPVEVEDATRKRLILNVEVEGTSGDGSQGADAGDVKTDAPALTDAEAVAKAITKKRQFGGNGDVELTITKPAKRQSETEITVEVKCNPSQPSKCTKPEEAAKIIGNALDIPKFISVLKIAGPPGCICAQ